AQVVIAAIPVALAVGLVVLTVVAHEVRKREAIVAGDEVDTVAGLPAARTVQIGAAGDAAGHGAGKASIAAHEATHDIPVRSIPFRPRQAREGADLIEAGRVPCFGNERYIIQ